MRQQMIHAAGWTVLVAVAAFGLLSHYGTEGRQVATAQHGRVCTAPTPRSER